MGSPSIRASNTDGMGWNWRFSTNISLYLRNGARSKHVWNANEQSYALYRMVLFPVTLSGQWSLITPKPSHFLYFVSPIIYSEWVELQTSNLVHNVGSSLVAGLGPNRLWKGVVKLCHSFIFWWLDHISAAVKARVNKFCIQVSSG